MYLHAGHDEVVPEGVELGAAVVEHTGEPGVEGLAEDWLHGHHHGHPDDHGDHHHHNDNHDLTIKGRDWWGN